MTGTADDIKSELQLPSAPHRQRLHRPSPPDDQRACDVVLKRGASERPAWGRRMLCGR